MREQTKTMRDLLVEFKELKGKLFGGASFVVIDEESAEAKRYSQLLQFFHPQFRTKAYVSPLAFEVQVSDRVYFNPNDMQERNKNGKRIKY